MIIGRVLPSMVDALSKCNVMLYLTGSRHFGGYTQDSDYDFFCEATQENFEMIASLGKWGTEEPEFDSLVYNDSNTVEVWKHYGMENIHIQFVRDVDKKVKVQKFLTGFPFHTIEKKARKYVWNWAYRQVS